MGNQNRSLFRLTRFILLKLPLLFEFFSKFRQPQKNLLIIKTDAIGDYFLFRNYLEIIHRSEKFKDYKITLLGNSIWQELSVKYDAGFVDSFLFIRPESLYDQPLQTLKLGWQLYINNFEVVLQPSSTRLLITDGLAALTAAKHIIGFEGDNEGLPARYKKKTDRFYTTKLVLPLELYFEFERSRFFFENVLSEKITINSLNVPVNKTVENNIVIFPGAGVFKRGWEKEKFLSLINLIRQNSSARITLAGGTSELQIGEYLIDNAPPGSVKNLIGKTSLLELVDLIAGAFLVIANETSAIHIAVATKTKSVCILGGGHFKRFAPYPQNFENAPVCVYEQLECFYCNWLCRFNTAEREPFPCISIIGLETVWQNVLPLL